MLARETRESGKGDSREPLPLEHVAIIMDGNRRWADNHKKPKMAGHKAGVKSLKRLVRYVGERRLGYLTVYAFSSENWQRTQEEVSYLLRLFNDVLKGEFSELAENRVRLRFLGQLDAMPEKLRASMHEAMDATRSNGGLNLQVAINYGSRMEVAEAARRIAEDAIAGKIATDEIDEHMMRRYLYTKDIPDPELLIRTGGDMRLSNYLLWQSAYTEFYVTDVLWPDFTELDFELAIEDFKSRSRRYGGD